mgnify:CR=1 FL=1
MAARSTGPALIQGGVALQQLWMFWVAPLIGGALGLWMGRVPAADRWLNPSLLVLLNIPALVVIVLAVTRRPPLPSLFAGVLLGGIIAIFLQGAGLHDVFALAQDGYTKQTGIEQIDTLLNSGGMQSMMWTISLMLIALGFGGALERTGCLEAIIQAIIARVKSSG